MLAPGDNPPLNDSNRNGKDKDENGQQPVAKPPVNRYKVYFVHLE